MDQAHPPTGSPPASSPHRATTWISRALVAAGLGLLVLLGCSTAASASPSNGGGGLTGTVSGLVDETPVGPIVESVTRAPDAPRPPAPEPVPVPAPTPLPAAPVESSAPSPTSPEPVAPATAPVAPIVQSIEDQVIETTTPVAPIVHFVEDQVIETTAPAAPIVQSIEDQVIDPVARTADPVVSEVIEVAAPIVDRVSRTLPSTTEVVADALAPLIDTTPTDLGPVLGPVAPTGTVDEPPRALVTSPLHEGAGSRTPISTPAERPTQPDALAPFVPQVTGTKGAHSPVATIAPSPRTDLRTRSAAGQATSTDETVGDAGTGLPQPVSTHPATGPIPACPVFPSASGAVGLLAVLSTSPTTGPAPATCLRATTAQATAPHPTLTPDVSPD